MSSAMAKSKNQRKPTKKIHQNPNRQPQNTEKPPSWAVIRGLLSCKYLQQPQQQPQIIRKDQQKQKQEQGTEENGKKCKKMRCSGSLCSNTKILIMERPETGFSEIHKKRASLNSSSSRSIKPLLNEVNGVVASSSLTSTSSSSSLSVVSSNSTITGSFRGMGFRRLSGCYECKMVIDPVLGITRDPSLRATICPCPDCGEIFMKPESLELHQAVKHAVSELGPDDTSRNIVEIIFQSSWLKKQTPICKIDRILKIHNTQKTISKFEEYRDSIKSKATNLPKKYPRCVADGNELLRFHCTTLTCSLGLNGSTNLCNSTPHCNVCSIIKNGFKLDGESGGKGILTTATSGKADDKAVGEGLWEGNEKRAMLVCRVIAGRVKKNVEGSSDEEYDSVVGSMGVYSNLEELFVFNPKAILPCFVVIYGGF